MLKVYSGIQSFISRLPKHFIKQIWSNFSSYCSQLSQKYINSLLISIITARGGRLALSMSIQLKKYLWNSEGLGLIWVS